jgi:hypothetical protein
MTLDLRHSQDILGPDLKATSLDCALFVLGLSFSQRELFLENSSQFISYLSCNTGLRNTVGHF